MPGQRQETCARARKAVDELLRQFFVWARVQGPQFGVLRAFNLWTTSRSGARTLGEPVQVAVERILREDYRKKLKSCSVFNAQARVFKFLNHSFVAKIANSVW